MSSFIADVGNSFRPGSMSNPVERNIHGVVGVVGVVCSIALAILGAPAVIWAISGAIFATLITGAVLESKGITYSAYIALFGLTFAAALLAPMPPAVWVVY